MRYRLVICILAVVSLLTFTSCGKQGAAGTGKDTPVSTQENEVNDGGFSGLEVEDSTEITLEEGQEFEIFE